MPRTTWTPASRSARLSINQQPEQRATQTAPSAALRGVIEVWNRVSAVSSTRTSPAVAPATSLNAPTTSGRTSPLRASISAPSIVTVVHPGSETIDTVQPPAGSATMPSSVPALTICIRSSEVISRSPCSGSATGSGCSGTVDSTTRVAVERVAAQLVVARSSTGW